MNKINDLVKSAHTNAVEKGFWDKPRETGTLIALIHSEVTEALDADDDDNFREELADICIRIFDLCGGMEIDLDKMLTRVDRTGEILEEFRWDPSSLSALENSISDNRLEYMQSMALDIHSFLSYALEADRKSNTDDFMLSITGAFVATLIWSANRGFKIEDAILTKMEKNRDRERLHGKNY